MFPSLHLTRFFDDYYGIYHLDEEQKRLILSLFQSIRHSLLDRSHDYRTGIDLDILSWLFKIIKFVQKKHQELPLQSDDPKYLAVYRIADYLSENCERPVSLDELCTEFYLSKSYICRIFKEVTGYTVSEYTNIHRIRKAKRYLEETDLSISELSHLLGFESVTYFERMFKRYTSLSPLKYRKNPDSPAP